MSSNLKRYYRSAVKVKLLVKNTEDTILEYTVVFRLKQRLLGRANFLLKSKILFILNVLESKIKDIFGSSFNEM